MISESTPLGLGVNPAVTAENVWDLWFAPVLDFITVHDVRLWSYINADWDAQPMWAGEGWGDSRIQQANALEERWRSEVILTEHFGGNDSSLGMVFIVSNPVKQLFYIGCGLALIVVVTIFLSMKAIRFASSYEGRTRNVPLVTHKFWLRANHDYGSVLPQEFGNSRSDVC